MRTHGTLNSTTFRNNTAPRGLFIFGSADQPARPGDLPPYHAHGRAALANALDEGLMADEVAQILDGREIVDAFPVWRGETPSDYAARAVAEMFVAYLQ
ncbi:hypothetical protein [Methylobacterium brachiatum]|uniref:hypothetical protein n=1 Tax=Methylobacterium brachiatum TaxID=269660 RepID=UPI0008EFDE4B|nr:hypothetical protein [Methylobacterium brachiatum]SFI62166.1 hypothetical protein SAMN02799642_02316 [Methylobacterium brachiatum]